jgi:GNAT superfamily N-acetyltransferase
MTVKIPTGKPAYRPNLLKAALDGIASDYAGPPQIEERSTGGGDRLRVDPQVTPVERAVNEFLEPYLHIRTASAQALEVATKSAVPLHAAALRLLIKQSVGNSTVEVLRSTRVHLKALRHALKSDDAPVAKSFPLGQLGALDRQIGVRLREIERVRQLPMVRVDSEYDVLQKGLVGLQSHTSWGHWLDRSLQEYADQWELMKHNTSIGVVHDGKDDKAIAAAAIFLEPRAGSGILGHLENVVTHKAYRRMGLAKRVVDDMVREARKAGCYAIMLSCLPKNAELYARCGFLPAGTQVEYNFTSTLADPKKEMVVDVGGIPHKASLRPLESKDLNDERYAALLQKGWLAFNSGSKTPSTLAAALESGQKQIYVIEDQVTRQIIGTGSVFFEHKLQEGSGHPTADVSDIVVDERYSKNDVGRAIFDQLKYAAQQKDAFRIMIQCSKEHLDFYYANGFHDTERQMMLPIDPAFKKMLEEKSVEELAPLK